MPIVVFVVLVVIDGVVRYVVAIAVAVPTGETFRQGYIF